MRLLATLLFLATFTTSAAAQVLEVKSGVLSNYTLVTGAVSYDGPVLQTYVVFGLPANLYGLAWSSVGLDNLDFGEDFDDEFDLILGYNRGIANFNLDVSAGVFFIARDAADLDGHVAFAGAKVSRSFGMTNVFASADTYAPTGGSTPGPGTLLWLGQTTTLTRGDWLEIDLITKVLLDKGAFGGERGVVWQPQTEVRFGSGDLQVFAGANGFVPRGGADIDRNSRSVVTFGVKLTPGRNN